MGQIQPRQNHPGLEMVGKGRTSAPSLGCEGSATSPSLSLGICSEEACTTRSYASYPRACAESGRKAARGGRSLRGALLPATQKAACVCVYIFILSAVLKCRASSLNILLCVLLATTSLSFYLFNKGNG